jgi:NAD(P)-dependent dehydrogenase (short-subunit alcohol dehydrogenase family)
MAHTICRLDRKVLSTARDVTDTDHIDRVFATVDREFGRVDCRWTAGPDHGAVWGEAVNSRQKKQV